MKHIYFLFFISFYCISCMAQSTKQNYTNAYNLNFTIKPDSTLVYPWLENAAFASYTFPVSVKDSSRTLFGRKYFNSFPFIDHLRTECQQRILLPKNNEQEGYVELQSKGLHLKSVFLIVDGINKEEKIIFSDTLQYAPDTLLSKKSMKIKLADIELLDIRIRAEGEIKKDAYIAFHSLTVLIGNKAIDEYPFRQLSDSTLINKTKEIASINLDTETGFEKINELKNKKIIGLGESTHLNNSIKKLVNQLILQAIEKQNCQFILMEMPLEKSLAYNRYIQDKNYKIDSLLSINHNTTDLLNKLRSLNSHRTNENKIKLLGMDYNTTNGGNQNSAIDIFDFVVPLNQEIKNRQLDQLAVLLMEKDWNNAITFLEANKKEVQKVLTRDEIDCILHILNLSNRMGKDGIERFIHRDSVMFVNAKFLVDKFSGTPDAQTIVYGHAVHLNPISTFPAVPCKPFGQYMQAAYAKEYLPLLLLVGNGQATAYDAEYNTKNKLLDKCPTGSIEFGLNSQEGGNTFYFPLTSDLNHLILSRFKGGHHIQQEFYPYNLYQRYGGIFFIKNTVPHQGKEIVVSFEDAHKQFLAKIKQRECTLREIKGRIESLKQTKEEANKK